jgi:hypothetical protein
MLEYRVKGMSRSFHSHIRDDRGATMKPQTQRQPKGEGCPLLSQLGIVGISDVSLNSNADNNEEVPF